MTCWRISRAPGRSGLVPRDTLYCSSFPMSPGADVQLGPGAEFDLIRKLRHHWGPLAVDIGDDAAVLRVPRGESMVISTDAALEDIHFRRDWLSLREIGYRAVTAALSDLAAMAASPAGVLVALQFPGEARAPGDTEATVLEIADGIADAVRAAGTVV